MSLTQRLLVLIVEAQSRADALEEKSKQLRQASEAAAADERQAHQELQAARERLIACQQEVQRAQAERDHRLADLRDQCQRLGIEAPDAP